MSQAQISAKKTRFVPKISSDIRSAAGELFIGPSQSLPEKSDGPTAIGEHCYILFELLDVEYGTPISQKNVKCNSPGLALTIDPNLPPGGISYTMIFRYYII